MTEPDGVQINQKPTGSIQTPSLCERTTLDQRVTTGGADSFDFQWVDDHYQVVYEDHATRDIFAVKLSPAGVILAPAVLIEQTTSVSSLPVLLQTETGFVVAWQEDDAHTVRTHGLSLDGNPAGQGHQIAMTRSSQMRPVLAPSPSGVAISWMDQAAESTGNNDVLGTSTTYLGLLDSSFALRVDVPLQQIGNGSASGYPWLAGSADELTVLFSSTTAQTDVYVAAVSPMLAVSAATDIRDLAASNAALLGRLDRTDFGYLASWEDHRSGEAEIYMALLDRTGKRYAGGLVEEPSTGNANWSHQAWTGSAAGLVYYQFRSGRPQIFMTFIDQTGTRIDGAADVQVSNTAASARFPSVRWDGSQFGVLWIDARNGAVDLYFNSVACKKHAPI